MKTRKQIVNETSSERKIIKKAVAAVCLLGAGLGVNLDEAWAGAKQNLTDATEKADIKHPSVQIDKSSELTRPSAEFAKTIKGDGVNRPSIDEIKLDGSGQQLPAIQAGQQSPEIRKPGVKRIKPVPAAKQQ